MLTVLEEELVRKEDAIASLKKENELLFKTAMKNYESKVDRENEVKEGKREKEEKTEKKKTEKD